MRNGTAFRYLKNQTDKQRESFIKKFPVLPSYTPEAFYYWYREIERLCYTYYMFVMPYYCVYQSCNDRRGFVIGDPLEDQAVDLHLDYLDIIPSFSQQLYQALERDGIAFYLIKKLKTPWVLVMVVGMLVSIPFIVI